MKRLREFEERQERRLTGRNICSCDDGGGSSDSGSGSDWDSGYTSDSDAMNSESAAAAQSAEAAATNESVSSSWGDDSWEGGQAPSEALHEASRDAYFAALNEKGLADPNEFVSKGADPITGRSEEEQFQYDADANNKGQGVNEAGQNFEEAMKAGTWSWADALKSAASTFGKVSGVAGPVVGAAAAAAHGIWSGSKSGIGISEESLSAINAANQATSQAVGNSGAVAAGNSSAAVASGGIGQTDDGSNGGSGGSGSPTTGGTTPAQVAGSIGVIPSSQTPSTTETTPAMRGFAEQLWWGSR